MSKAHIAGIGPLVVNIKANTDYWYCTCGLSDTQPFCNGSHTDTDFTPTLFRVDADQEVYFCQCKRSKRPPFCDGQHKSIRRQELNQHDSK